MTPPRPLRVLALAPYPASAPSTRVRVSQFLPGLEAAGIQVRLHPFLDEDGYRAVRGGPGRAAAGVARAVARLAGTLGGLDTVDVVWVQRGVAPLADLGVMRAVAAAGTPLVFDFDDAVFLPQERGRPWVEAARRPGPVTAAWCRQAAVVLAGNGHLASYAREAVGRAGAHVVRMLPSVVDTDVLTPGVVPVDDPPTLGWVGTDSTVPYLESLAPALEALARRMAFRLLVVAGERSPRVPRSVDLEVVRWTPEGEVDALRRMHVGLYPLDDTPWSRGKCGFKALQYLACGIPCVASPVGVLPHIVVPGRTGFLAASAGAWVESCATLLADPEGRARMGAEGRARVEAEYSLTSALPRLAGALRLAGGERHG